ncbi:MAG: hypothetical protein PHO87_04590 [Acholeplasmataceae bacterium]|nr:hypothetical protein [Acholeplasmataceae bacterium]
MKLDIHTEKKDIQLVPFGDLHYGDKSCNWAKAQKMIDWIKNNNNTRVILMGDLLNSATKTSVGAAVFDEDRHGQDQLDFMIDALRPIKKKIYGALVGNHPYHKDTEVMTKYGWKNINMITLDDLVAQFNIETNEITYDNPTGFNKLFTEEVITIENNYTKQIVNPEHNVVYNKTKIKAKDLIDKSLDKLKFNYYGNCNNVEIVNLSTNELRLITWIVMDGCMVFRDGYPHHIQFKLSKERKIKELCNLLDDLKIKYTIKESKKTGLNILQPYIIRLYTDSKKYFKLLNNKKEFPLYFLNLNRNQILDIINTIVITDGYKSDNHISWTTINKNNIDIIMQCCINNGICFKYDVNKSKSGFDNAKSQYKATITYNENIKSFQNIKIKKEEYNDFCYCLTMPEGTLITRIHGKVAFSGNCQRIIDSTGYDPIKFLCNELHINHYGYGQFIKIKGKGTAYNIYATHGSSSSTLPYTKIKGCLNLAMHKDADLYLMGHVHDLQLHTQEVERIQYNQVIKDKRYFILTGHYLNYDGSYAEMKNICPSKQGSPVIDLCMSEKQVRVKI